MQTSPPTPIIQRENGRHVGAVSSCMMQVPGTRAEDVRGGTDEIAADNASGSWEFLVLPGR